MIKQLLGYFVGGKLIVGIIVVIFLLFLFAIIRYLSDRGGSYF